MSVLHHNSVVWKILCDVKCTGYTESTKMDQVSLQVSIYFFFTHTYIHKQFSLIVLKVNSKYK